METTVVTRLEPPLGWVIFNRPEVKNAFNLQMWEDVPKAILEVAQDPKVRVILLKGEGGHFGAGADIKELLKYAQDPLLARAYADKVNFCFSTMGQVEIPLIALVEGYTLGGGAMVATACDLRVVSKNATVGIPLPRLGLAVEPLGIKRLVETVGLSWASKFLLTADPIPQEELRLSGWASSLVDQENLEREARDLASRILKSSPTAIQMTKRILHRWLQSPLEGKDQVLAQAFAKCMLGDEFQEGAQAFIEKRKPKFSL